MSPKVVPQLRQTRPFAGLGTTVVFGAVRVMRRLPPHLPRTGPSSRAGRNWHLPLRERAGGGCRGFVGPCPSAPLDEWNADDCTGPPPPGCCRGWPRPMRRCGGGGGERRVRGSRGAGLLAAVVLGGCSAAPLPPPAATGSSAIAGSEQVAAA